MKKRKRSVCPVANTLDIVGDRWTLLVVRDLMQGRSHFSEFTSSPEQIATNILADRLSRLTLHGLVEKTPSPVQPGRDAYRLTEKGESLCRVVAALADWGLENIKGTNAASRTAGPSGPSVGHRRF